MILLTTYDFYQNTYKGQLSSDLFDNLIPKASFEIGYNVNRELTEEDAKNEKVQMVACMYVDFLNANDISLNAKNVQSISIDGVSRTYGKLTKEQFDSEKVKILDKLPIELRRYR